jgi:hypothetical protein
VSRRTVILRTKRQREQVARWAMNVDAGTVVEFRQATRSIDQNSLLWARLGELSKRLEWHGQKLSPDDWKCLATASLRKCRFVPGMDPGTVVPLGLSTSSMTKAEMADLLTLLEAFAAEHGITFQDQIEAAE